MGVNSMTFMQSASLLNSIYEQVTGKNGTLTSEDTKDFMSIATATLACGYDPVLNAISQVMTRTIFGIRPYNATFRALMMDNQKWGAIVRKLNISDQDWENSQEFDLIDGQSVDQYVVKKPSILQMNFYGAMVYQRSYTIFKDQLDNAFTGPEQFGEFMTMVTQNCLDIIEQCHENIARLTVANFVAGKYAATNGIIHCLTEYNTETGITPALTATTVYDPANFGPFIKWLYARIADLTKLMTERSQEFQIQVTGKEITRHTPLEYQKVLIYSKFLEEINARVKADTYHDNFLELSDVEAVPFWQNINDRMNILCKPVYLKTDGTLEESATDVSVDNVIGVIYDEEAMGMTVMNEWSAVTPMNAAAGYWNIFYHFTERYYSDFSEKGIVLLLD